VTDLIVFSDLDGTLLDHGSYSFAAARPALDALAERAIPLVLATSKTAAEVAILHAAMDLGATPAIVENGAGLYVPGQARETPGGTSAYDALRRSLDALPTDLRAGFTGFGDMAVEEVAAQTGLSVQAAARARQRQHSEPGLWHGPEARRDAFVAALARSGIAARAGGRFLTLSFGRTKADGLRQIMSDLGGCRSLALGDAPNDVELLQAADHGVIVRNDHGPGIPALPGEAEGRITRTVQPGPAGWAAAVLAFLHAPKD
jgi:mannosyl-3-phosphoglycerate phosphatase